MPILNWLGRDEALKTAAKTPYRLLEEVPELGYGDKSTDNMIIQGDNLEALKALLPFYAGQVKCIYIDPPYNTGSAFEHYDDNLEHSTWLSMMYPRLELLKEFLREDGCILVQLDDMEMHYGKVILDEIFGRKNFISNIVWHKKRGKDNSSRYFSITHDNVLVFAKNAAEFFINRIAISEETKKAYTNPDNDSRGIYRLLGLWARQQGGSEYEYVMSNGKIFSKRLWLVNQETMKKLEIENRIVQKGNNLYRKLFLYENKGSIPETIWTDVSNNANAKDELKKLFGREDLFDTPKPEPLIERIIQITTNPNDLVLDSFLGSGTTAAVAQKMGRRYIGIEMGNHAITHCVPRLKAVVDGEQGGISKAVNWQGGGGFRFYKLGNEVFDADGCINEGISFEDLSAHIWFTETKTPFNKPAEKSTFLGIKDNVAYALLYNGILKDKRVDGGNVLTNKTLNVILDDMHNAPYDKLVIYGESSRIGQPRLKSLNIEFKQTPYDIKAR